MLTKVFSFSCNSISYYYLKWFRGVLRVIRGWIWSCLKVVPGWFKGDPGVCWGGSGLSLVWFRSGPQVDLEWFWCAPKVIVGSQVVSGWIWSADRVVLRWFSFALRGDPIVWFRVAPQWFLGGSGMILGCLRGGLG